MRYLTLSPLLRLRLENTDNIIHILGGQYHLENTGNRVLIPDFFHGIISHSQPINIIHERLLSPTVNNIQPQGSIH